MSYDGIEYLASIGLWTKMVHTVKSNYTLVTEAIVCNIDYNGASSMWKNELSVQHMHDLSCLLICEDMIS